MLGPLRLRSAEPGDAPAMAAVRDAAIRQLCGSDHLDNPETIAAWIGDPSPNKFIRLLQDEQARLSVALRDDTLVGLAGFSGDLVTLNYVHPEHRFSGVSRALMEHIEQHMSADGIITARLFSTVTAHRFYQAIGWQDAGLGSPDQGIPMCKQLSISA
jgi:GNAT superfamily N-acetyltransferase